MTLKFILPLSGLLVLLSSTQAADLSWGVGGAGGAGTWDNGITANWFNGSASVPWSAGSGAVFGGSAGTVTVSGTIPGVQGLAFNASGYLLSGGGLSLSGTPSVIAVGSGLFATNNSFLSGNSGLTIGGNGTLVVGGAVTNSGVTINPGATMVANAALALQATTNLTVNGTLDVKVQGSNLGMAPVLNGSGLITNSGASVVNLRVVGNGGLSGNFGGTIAGPLAFVYQGSSTQTLSGVNSYSGFTLLRNSGTLRLASVGALSPNSYLDFQAGTMNVLELAAGDLVRSNAAAAPGVSFTTGGGSGVSAYFAAIGADRVVTITNAAANMTWGTSPFAPATLGFGSLNSTHKVTWTGPFSLGAPTSGADRTIDVLDGPAAVDAEISGVISSGNANPRLYKGGAGTLVLSGANTYNSETRLAAGTLALANDSAAGSGTIRFHLAGATLRSTDASTRTLANNLVFALDPILGSAGTGDLIINGTVDTGGGGKTITVSNAVTTLNSDVFGASGNPNVKAGPGKLVLNSFTSFIKPLQIAAGTLALGPSAGLLSTNILVGTNGLFDVSAIADGYSLNSGQTLCGGGVVTGSVTVANGAFLSPGTSVGTLTFADSLTLSDTTVLLELTNNATEGGGVNDLIQVNKGLSLLGTSTISLVPLAGNLANGTYKLIKYGGALNGGVGNLTLTGFGGGTTRQVANLQDSIPHEIDLVVSGAPASLVWKGTDSVSPAAWDVVTTTNWLRGASPDGFFNFDNVTFNDSASRFEVNLTTALSPSSVTVDTAGTYVFSGSGNLTGITGLTKNGAGTLVLGNWGANDNGGTTTINAGTLMVGNNNDGSGSLGPGPVVNDSVLSFRTLNPLAVRSAISGNGRLLHEGQSDVVLNGSNSFTGLVLVSPYARLTLASTAVPPSTAAGLGQSTNVTVQADGALYLALNGTFNQPLFLSGDGYQYESSGALRTAGNISWNGPVKLESDTTIGADSGTLTLNSALAGGACTLTKAGAGTLLLATNNTYGPTVISAGTLQVGNGGTNGTLGQSSAPIQNDGSLVVNRSDTVTVANNITGTGGVTQSGSGTLVLNGNNTFTGELRVSAGTLALGSDSASGLGSFRFHTAATVASADSSTRTVPNSIDFAWSTTFGTATSGNLLFTGPVNTGSGAKTFTVNNAQTVFNGALAGGPSANSNAKAGPGTLIFNGINTYDKPTVVSEGTLLINGSLATNTVTVNGGTLGGTGLISGPVTVQAAGTLAPGASIGTLTISNTLTLAGTVAVEVNKSAGTCDLLEGLTSVNYGGTLTVTNLLGSLAPGDAFKLFNAGSYSGTFSGIIPATPGAGMAWNTNSLTTDGTLRITTGTVNYSTNITAVLVSENTLEISWPETHLGWILQGQTNAPGLGLSAAWYNLPDSDKTNKFYLTLDPALGSVFYRLISPQ